MAEDNTARHTSIEALLRRDKLVTVVAIAVLVVIAAFYTIFGVGMKMSAIEMTPGLSQSKMAMPNMGAMKKMVMEPASWSITYGVLVFLMWWVMMVAMMLPSASPMILLYTALIRRTQETRNIFWEVSLFILGYLIAWAIFSIFAALLQSQLELKGWMSPMMMEATNNYLIAIILISAGVYQLTPLKTVCLEKCRQPASFLANYKNTWVSSPLRIGLVHGFYCLGCCWFLMGLLFFGGIMNLYWIVGLIIFVAIEKLHERGIFLGKVLGAGAILLGITFLF
ncbi:MAG: DUF2182 domain-containing protein [Nisaea sp.]|jgi:predicted metal-binding membrane protein|nr:DUF2182 domain-containing protein [Nisaea sp.]